MAKIARSRWGSGRGPLRQRRRQRRPPQGDGTEAKPFATHRQGAVGVVPKDLGGHTAAVIVAPGTYGERL